MKGILTICALALLGSTAAKTFPNDLYYHHHPDLAVADAFNDGYSRGRNNLREGSHRSSFILKEGPYSGPEESTGSVTKSAYRANYDSSDKKGYLVYNEDGSINWDATKAKTHKNSVADDMSNNGGYDYHGRNPHGNNRMSNSNSDNRYNDDGDHYGYDSRNTGPGSNRFSASDNNRYDDSDYNNYNQGSYNNRGNNQGSRGDRYGGNNQGYNNYDDINQGSQKYNAYRDPGNGKAGFGGGMRIAGADTGDGYLRGVGTFYDLETHTGTCGKQNKNSEFVAALNAEQMGDSSSNNPNCGKEVEVTGPNGKTITVTIVDSCKTCESGDLDFSPAAFGEIGDFSHGSIPIKWKFM